MARIPPDELERLKAGVSVERLVEASGVALKAVGKDLHGRCPFHDDREASLVVTPTKNLWHCFSCQIGGGPIDWLMKAKGVSFRHAVELLREGTLEGMRGRGTRLLPAPIADGCHGRAFPRPRPHAAAPPHAGTRRPWFSSSSRLVRRRSGS